MFKPSLFLGLIIILFSTFNIAAQSGSNLKDPSFEEVLSLKSVRNPIISPDGQHIIFTKGLTDWENNRYDSELWLYKNGLKPFQLTRTKKGSSFGAEWSPDGQWIAFLANRDKKNQIHVINVNGGEAAQITHEADGINSFVWSPDGKSLTFTKLQAKSKPNKEREKRYGKFEEDDHEFRLTWLYQIPFDPNHPAPSEIPCYDDKDSTKQSWPCIKWPKPIALVDSVEFTVRNFAWSPDGSKIAITHTPTPLINDFMNSTISLYDVATKKLEAVIDNPAADFFVEWSPNSDAFIYDSDLDNRTSNYYLNSKIFIYELENQKSRRIAQNFDENLRDINWTPSGIYATASQKTQIHLFKVDPITGKATLFSNKPKQILDISLSKNGSQIAFRAAEGNDLPEIYKSNLTNFNPDRITNATNQIKDWKVAQSEVISWDSKDGATIEGVLHKPHNYDPEKKYPLLVAIHGGPTGVDRPTPILSYVYPVNQWLNKGALVLRVNYRGSAGYGEAFRSLNVRNLGVGDAWDVLSGVDHLANLGIIDTTKMGCMGWSQGGYISAFLTTSSNRFKAISVGAGISNWMTYYVNTDIHPFTRQYLKATPWEDMDIYHKTSPMTHINKASTPTLIQHGEFDRRVPIPNAYELLQGLRDVGVDAKLVVYKGFGHGITKPKERLAAIWHNWQWFNKYLWKEAIELPVGKEKDK